MYLIAAEVLDAAHRIATLVHEGPLRRIVERLVDPLGADGREPEDVQVFLLVHGAGTASGPDAKVDVGPLRAPVARGEAERRREVHDVATVDISNLGVDLDPFAERLAPLVPELGAVARVPRVTDRVGRE